MGQPDARRDWEERIGRRSAVSPASPRAMAEAPSGVVALPGRGQVTLEWEPVPGAVGYVVLRGGDGDRVDVIDNGAGDSVQAVPGPPYADTTGVPGASFLYAVAALTDADGDPGPRSRSVESAALHHVGSDPVVTVAVECASVVGPVVRPWWMIGSERLSQLGHEDGDVGDEFATAIRLAVDELGVTAVRAHSILHDDLGVYREEAGRPRFDFNGVDRVYDDLLALGAHPIVEVSFMPRDLASDPTATVFTYDAIISPPRDWDLWAELVRRLAAHLVERYGIDEVAGWAFEIWNEPNLEVFWTGSQDDYFRLYETAARAIKGVDRRLRVGGPATAAAGWITDFLDFVTSDGVPLDFVTTHAYGIPPLAIGQELAAHGLVGRPVWWTEWGVTPTHFAPVNDSAFGAPFALRGMKAAQGIGHADALAYWVISDHFEELGRPPSLLHGGFGLLTVGNLRKPRYWAMALAAQLGRDELAVTISGDGARSLVDAMAARGVDGTVDVLVWNGTLDQSKSDGSALLGRAVRLRVDGLPAKTYEGTLARIDADHSNIGAHWRTGHDVPWPGPEEWARLRAVDRLWEQPVGELRTAGGSLDVVVALPMPGVARLRLRPPAD